MRFIICCALFISMSLTLFGDIFGTNTYINYDIPVKIRDNVEDVVTNYSSTFILLKNNEMWVTGDQICGGDIRDTYTKFASGISTIGKDFYITTGGDLYMMWSEIASKSCPRKMQSKVQWYDGWSMVVKNDNSLWDYYDPQAKMVYQNLIENHINKIMDNVQKAWRSFCYDPCSKDYKGSYSARVLIKTDNNLYVQGMNVYGQLGVGNKLEVVKLLKVMDDTKLVALNAFQTFVLKNDKTLWVAGESLSNFGNGSKAGTTSFIKVADDVIDVQLGEVYQHGTQTFILKSDGSLWFSGINLFTNLAGITVPLIRDLPKENLQFVKILSDVKKFSLYRDHLLYIKNDNSLWGLGRNI